MSEWLLLSAFAVGFHFVCFVNNLGPPRFKKNAEVFGHKDRNQSDDGEE